MPAKSRSQQRLMQAAEHGAQFPMAQKIRSSMSMAQMHDFAVGSEKGKPGHVARMAAPRPGPIARPSLRQPHANLGKYLHAKKVR
jgi:hypothetical protein